MKLIISSVVVHKVAREESIPALFVILRGLDTCLGISAFFPSENTSVAAPGIESRATGTWKEQECFPLIWVKHDIILREKKVMKERIQ